MIRVEQLSTSVANRAESLMLVIVSLRIIIERTSIAWEPRTCLSLVMNSDASLLLETVNFAAEKHRNQRRKDPQGTPYINHPIGG